MSMTDDIRNHLSRLTAPATVNQVALDLGLTNKQASSALSRLAKNGEAVKTDDGYSISSEAVEQPETPVEQPEDDLIGEAPTEETPAPEKPEEPSDLKHVEVREFPGNYSIAMIPFTETLAVPFDGVKVRSENVKGSLVRKAFISSDRKTDLTAFLKVLDQKVAEVFPALKVWQKENIEERRGLTDMQRYVGHREFIEGFAVAVAADLTA